MSMTIQTLLPRPIRRLALGAVAFAGLLATIAAPANAIGNGKPDVGYEGVGTLGVYLPTPPSGEIGGPFGLCSGFVISDRAFVTAAHCLAEIAALRHVPQAWAVALDAGSPEHPIILPGVFTTLNDIVNFPIEVETHSPIVIHEHPGFDEHTFENDVAVLEFPVGTFKGPYVKLAGPRLLRWLKRLRILKRIPIGLVGYGATGPAFNDMGDFIGLAISGHRNKGFGAVGSASKTRLFLETTPVLDSTLLLGDSGSPQFLLGRAVSLSSEPGFGEQRLDTPAVRKFLYPFCPN